MPQYSIRIPARPDISVPVFTAAQMQQIGQGAIVEMRDRIARAVDVFDKPAPPLQPRYAKQKIRAGKQPVRDILLTGNTLGSVQVIEADQTHVKVGIRGATPYRKALFNQNIDPWFGLSNQDDERVLNEVVKPIFSQNIANALK